MQAAWINAYNTCVDGYSTWYKWFEHHPEAIVIACKDPRAERVSVIMMECYFIKFIGFAIVKNDIFGVS